MNTPQQRLAHEVLLEGNNTVSAFKKYQKHNTVLSNSTSTAVSTIEMYCIPQEAPEPNSFVKKQQNDYDMMCMKIEE